MIIVRLKSGLGNQLFQYAIGLNLSQQKKCRLLFDFSLFNQGNRKFKLKYFELEYDSISKFKLTLLSSNFVFYLSKLLQFDFYHKVIKDPMWEYLELPKKDNLILIGYWSFNQYFEGVRSDLLAKFRLNDFFFNNTYLNWREKIQNTEAVAIHIRRGDYLTDKEFNAVFGVLPEEYYFDGIELIKLKVKNPCFFVFSDDPCWVNENFKIEEEYFVVSEQEELADYHEFDLMRNCKHHIIANSTFSWWAAYLNDNEGRVIIQPRKWYKSEHAQKVYDSKKFLFIEGAIRV